MKEEAIKMVDVESMLFKCNYNVKDLTVGSQFYLQLLKWWSEFREDNTFGNKNWHYFISNNQEVRVNNKPIFYEKYFNVGIRTADNLRFDLSNLESYELIAKNKKKTNFLE